MRRYTKMSSLSPQDALERRLVEFNANPVKTSLNLSRV